MTKRTAIAEMFNPGLPKQAIPGRVHAIKDDEPTKAEATRTAKSAYQSAYYLKNRAALASKKASYAKDNRDKTNAQKRAYYARNRQRMCAEQKERYQREKGKP